MGKEERCLQQRNSCWRGRVFRTKKKGGAGFRKKTEELSVGAGCRKNPGNWWKLGVSGQREIGKARLRRCEARKGD